MKNSGVRRSRPGPAPAGAAANESPIEVWLSMQNLGIQCRVVLEDESTAELNVDSLSMRGAQREITGWYVSRGYKPVAGWETEEVNSDGMPIETVRQFKLAPHQSDAR